MDKQEIKKQIQKIEEEIRQTPYHKGTERHIGRLKAKLAGLRQGLVEKTTGGGGGGFAVKKTGDATVVMVGMPSVGKSTLLNKLTGAHSKVGHYPFTTLEVIPGVLHHKGAHIQIFDVPGLIRGASEGKGGGKEILSVVRVADLLLMIASAEKPNSLRFMKKELERAGVRINRKPPKIEIRKKARGGIRIQGAPGLSEKTIETLAREFRLMNAEIKFQEKVNQDQLIDTLIGNRVYIKALSVFSKSDLLSEKQKKKIRKKYPESLLISSKKGDGLEELKERIFEALNLIRVFLKEASSSEPEEEPLILKKGDTVEKAAREISGSLAEQIKGARIKGPSAAFPNQRVGTEHKLQDKDQVCFLR